VVKSTDRISKAFKLIFKHSVSSLPVYDVEKKTFTSFVEIIDLVLFVIRLTRQEVIGIKPPPDFSQLISNPTLRNHRCSELANISELASFIPIDSTVSLHIAVEETILSNLERLVVLNSDREILGVLSQSRIVEIFSPAILLSDWVDLKLSELPICQAPSSIRSDKTVLDAFKEIYRQKWRSIAIVNESDHLVGTISSSDLKHLKTFQIEFSAVLNFSLDYFLSEVSIKIFRRSNPGAEYPLVFGLQHTVKDVIESMKKTHFHQYYVVQSKKPIGMITYFDILKLMATKQEKDLSSPVMIPPHFPSITVAH